MSVPPKVSRELADAVQEDALRAARDEAHRAVRQMEGYDVFQNMVASRTSGRLPGDASHMTATDRAAARAPRSRSRPRKGVRTRIDAERVDAADAGGGRRGDERDAFRGGVREDVATIVQVRGRPVEVPRAHRGYAGGTNREAVQGGDQRHGPIGTRRRARRGARGRREPARRRRVGGGARRAGEGEARASLLGELARGRFALAAKLMGSGGREAMRTLVDALVANGALDAGAAEALKSAYGCG